MPRINISVKIKNATGTTKIEVPAIVQDDIIKYKENNDTTVKYNYQTNELIRENNELRMSYQFLQNKKTTGKIYVKELKNELTVQIKTTKLKRKDNDIEIEFQVEDDKFLYQIEVLK